jgi:DNA-binding NarL/FixJ family response regulator
MTRNTGRAQCLHTTDPCNTAKVHVKAILHNAQVGNRTQVAMWASRLGLGQVPRIAP